MDLRLAGRAALVTGGSGGIGAAIAELLAAEGCAVLVHGRDRDRAEAVAARVEGYGVRGGVVLGDLSDDRAAAGVTDSATAFRARIVVNNAGPLAEHDWDTADPADWLAMLDGNVVSAVRVTRALLPALRADGWGRVINLGSRAVATPLPHLAAYSAAKAAVVNMTTSLALHLAGTGVTANAVSPGVVLTPTMQSLFSGPTEPGGAPADWSAIEPEVTSEYAPNPTGRLGRPDDIANAVVFLASPLAGYINGIDLRVDGGLTGTP